MRVQKYTKTVVVWINEKQKELTLKNTVRRTLINIKLTRNIYTGTETLYLFFFLTNNPP